MAVAVAVGVRLGESMAAGITVNVGVFVGVELGADATAQAAASNEAVSSVTMTRPLLPGRPARLSHRGEAARGAPEERPPMAEVQDTLGSM